MKLIFSSQAGPCLIQNMDIEKGGNVKALLHPYTAKEMNDFLVALGKIVGSGFFERGGLEAEQVINNFTNHSLRSAFSENQYFKGRWETKPKDPKERALSLTLITEQDVVFGDVTASDGRVYQIDHLYMLNDKITLTFLTKSGRMLELKGVIEGNKLKAKIYGTENYLGDYIFYKAD